MADLALGNLLNLAGSVVLVGFGVFVLTIRPRRRGNQALAAYAFGLGAAFAARNANTILAGGGPPLPALHATTGAAFLVACTATVALVTLLPHPLPSREHRTLVASGLIGLLSVALPLADVLARPAQPEWVWSVPAAANLLNDLGSFSIGGTTLFALHLLAARFRRTAPAEDAVRRQIALMSVGLMVYIAYLGGLLAAPRSPLEDQVFAAGILSVPVVWATAMRGPAPRVARAVCWSGLALALLGALGRGALPGGPFTLAFGVGGVLRIAGVAILTYAVVRHQLLGIDVKVRWGISKTTIAAVFIAVFFIASESAQQFFGETLGSAYVGILAAGALVFAIAPLSRLADRVAERAVPVAHPIPPAPTVELTYRRTLERLLADGVLSRDDEALLAGLAADLGLDARRAFELRDEVERHRGGA